MSLKNSTVMTKVADRQREVAPPHPRSLLRGHDILQSIESCSDYIIASLTHNRIQ